MNFVFLFLSTFAFTYSLKLNKKTSFNSNVFLQITTKLQALSSYVNEYSKLQIQLKNIHSSQLYAYYNKTSKNIIVDSNVDVENGFVVASGSYQKTRFKNGWDVFSGKTYNNSNPIIQFYALGIIEGILSHEEIYYYRNNFEYFFEEDQRQADINELKNLFEESDKNIRNKIKSLKNSFYKNNEELRDIAYLSCLHAQINGLYEGYNLAAPQGKKLDLYDLYLLNSEGYYSGLKDYMSMNKVNFNTTNDFFNNETLLKYYKTNDIEKIWKSLIKKSHCSGIVKLINNLKGKNIYFGHNTWTGYNELLRTLKKIDFAFEGDKLILGMKPMKIKYSSYPGVLFSGDEFYQINSNLAVLQTSLSIINRYTLKDAIDIKSYIPEFIRIMMINFNSLSGKDWLKKYLTLFKGNHLYPTQWIILDYNKLRAKNGLMYIVEEMPKSVKYIDYTKELKRKGYYGSFNLPFFKDEHTKIAGLDKFDVNFFDKHYNPREYILKNLEKNVTSIKDFKNLLMYNGYKVKDNNFLDDPSYEDSSNGIASREGNENGAIDFKIVDKKLMKDRKIWVYSGPVYDTNPNFEPYNVSKATEELQNHSLGIPTIWKFKSFIFK